MTRVKCKKCGAVFEQGLGGVVLSPHIGPLHYIKCPACRKSSFFNVYSSVKEAVTYPPPLQETTVQQPEQLSEEELEKRRIEESKYEKP